MGEQGSESIHAYFNSLGRTYRDDTRQGGKNSFFDSVLENPNMLGRCKGQIGGDRTLQLVSLQ